jgi:lipopolysaccharide heptosyltransferase II
MATSPSPLHKVLVLRLSSIGDVLLATPFLRALRRAAPDCEIHFAVRREYEDLLRDHPAIDRLITIDAAGGRRTLEELNHAFARERYDAVFDLHNSYRTRLLRNGLSTHTFVVNKRQLRRIALLRLKWNLYGADVPVPERYIETGTRYGLVPDEHGLDLYLAEDVPAFTAARLPTFGVPADRPCIGLCPGSRHFTKRWPADHLRALIALLLKHTDAHLLLLGDARDAVDVPGLLEMDPGRVHDLRGAMSLPESAAAMDRCAAVLVNDSGLMHIATARRRPVVALFGSTVREFGFFPYHADACVLEVPGLPCRPCTHIGRSRCPRGHFRCMRDITPEAVFEALITAMKGARDDDAPMPA